MRDALDTMRTETDTMSRSHQQLSQSISKEIETPLADFLGRTENTRRPSQLNVEKLHRHKQAQMQYVQRAREKYEHDCTKVNAYTAQSNLVQGRELDKLMGKLERVQATVGENDKEYQSYVRALHDTTNKWNAEWKNHLDICQDLEEDRQEFLKANLWSLANAISTVCVTDDEACERVRVSLERCNAVRDVSSFVREFGTGPAIPAPPEYINYAQGQAPPTLPPHETAHFSRLSTRPSSGDPGADMGVSMPTPSVGGGTAPSAPQPSGLGVGATPAMAGISSPAMGAENLAPGSRGSFMGQSRTPPPQGRTPPPQGRTPPPQGHTPPLQGRTPPLQSMNTNSMFAPGGPPLARTPSPGVGPGTGAGMGAGMGAAGAAAASEAGAEGDDPIAKALANLRLRQSQKGGSRPTSAALSQDKDLPQPNLAEQGPRIPAAPAESRSSMQPSGSMVDPRMQQRPASPSAAFMQAGPNRSSSPLPVERIMSQYGQSFPAERRSQSPAPGGGSRPSSQLYSQGNNIQRGGTPLGIALDAQGSVTQDEMADDYRRRHGASPFQQPPQQQAWQQPAQQPGQAATSPRSSGYGQMPPGGAPGGAAAAPPRPASAAPPPTGQYSDSGEPILFYGTSERTCRRKLTRPVKALYDYQASLPEEFSFTAGDIIAVTHTEPDGWWQGELLDEKRRVPGANTFPSNFVVLLM